MAHSVGGSLPGFSRCLTTLPELASSGAVPLAMANLALGPIAAGVADLGEDGRGDECADPIYVAQAGSGSVECLRGWSGP